MSFDDYSYDENYEEENYGDEDYEGFGYEEEKGDGEDVGYGEDNVDFGEYGLAEKNAFERVGMGNGILGVKTDWKEKRDPYAVFKEQVNATILFFNDVFFEHMNLLSDLKKILDKIDKLKYVEYKNPYAFVLGYICYDKQPEYIQIYVFNKLEKINESNQNNVTKEDVVRYLRLWESL
jgi:hypothetical protein